jgi:hypothetical protein
VPLLEVIHLLFITLSAEEVERHRAHFMANNSTVRNQRIFVE